MIANLNIDMSYQVHLLMYAVLVYESISIQYAPIILLFTRGWLMLMCYQVNQEWCIYISDEWRWRDEMDGNEAAHNERTTSN
jgi:hypothetical protein